MTPRREMILSSVPLSNSLLSILEPGPLLAPLSAPLVLVGNKQQAHPGLIKCMTKGMATKASRDSVHLVKVLMTKQRHLCIASVQVY